MTTKTGSSVRLLGLVVAGVLVAVAGVQFAGGGGGGSRRQNHPECEHTVTYTANWEVRTVSAESLRYGPKPRKRQHVLRDVWPAFQETQNVECDTVVSMEVLFRKGLDEPPPGRVMCAITFNNVVYEPDVPPTDRRYSCFVQTYVS